MHSLCPSSSCPAEPPESINLEMEICYVLQKPHQELRAGSGIGPNYNKRFILRALRPAGLQAQQSSNGTKSFPIYGPQPCG